VVHEEILATVIRGDKAVALLVVEPLNRSLGHILEPTSLLSWAPPNKKPPLFLRAALNLLQTQLQLPI
jgi:hypothetical protein